MGYENPSEYGNIERRRGEQNKIIKWQRRFIILISFSLSYMMVNTLFSLDKDVFSSAQFFVNWSDVSDGDIFRTKSYVVYAGATVAFFILLFFAPSKLEMIRKLEILRKKNKKFSTFDYVTFKIISYLDYLFLWLMFPISYIVFNVGTYSPSVRDKFFFRIGWLSHIELSFFKEVAVKVDGYDRVRELKLLAKFKELFSREKGDSIYGCNIYQATYNVFRSDKEFRDLMLIAEGSLVKSVLYDKEIEREEYLRLLNDKFKGDIYSFRCYDNVGEILFSFDLIKDIIDAESIKFISYMKKYALSSRQMFTRSYMKNFIILKRDKKAIGQLAALPLPKPCKEEEMLASDAVFTQRVVEFCEVVFRIVAFKAIMGRYMNLPAGTMVVKIENYSVRMSIEMYDEEALIQIVPGKNDGTSPYFNGDALTNIFLSAYNYYNLSSRVSFVKHIEQVFNFVDKVTEDKQTDSQHQNGEKDFSFVVGYSDAPSK